MQNKLFSSKLNTVLLIIIIVLLLTGIYIFNKRTNTLVTNSPENILVTDNNYESQMKWATEENGLPKGWVRWTDTMAEIPVEKYGPSQIRSSYMIKLNAKMVSGIDQEKKCVGDSETALCAVGNNPEILRYFNVISFR